MKTSNGNIVFSHSEYFADLQGSDLFKVRQLSLNPGNSDIFPYLSNIAASFEYYRFKHLRLRYEPSCSTATPGSVMLCIDYDAADGVPLGKAGFMMNQNATRTSCWTSCVMDLVAAANGAQIKRFVLNDVPPLGTDIKTYNLGNLFIATIGAPTTIIGELYVDYEVELSVPQGATNSDVTAELFTVQNTDPTSPWELGEIRQNLKNPILEVPGVNSPAISPNVDVLKVIKAGHYILNATILSTTATGAGTNANVPNGWAGSGVNISNMPSSTVSTITAGVVTIGQWLLDFDPTLATDLSRIGWFIFPTMAAVATPFMAGGSRLFLSRQPLPLQDSSTNI
jgi:hypothetical protein